MYTFLEELVLIRKVNRPVIKRYFYDEHLSSVKEAEDCPAEMILLDLGTQDFQNEELAEDIAHIHKSVIVASETISYIVAPPRMALYMAYSARVYGVYLRFVSQQDIHPYSIDEVFINAAPYLDTYKMTARQLAMKMVRAVLAETGITATAGIGTNMYLAKVAMDITAKHMPSDKDGVRIAELNESFGMEQALPH